MLAFERTLKIILLSSYRIVNTAGWGNFVVGLTNDDPEKTAPCFKCTYTICRQHAGVVTPRRSVLIICAASTETFRYVIVLDAATTPQALCLAEVAVYDKRKLTD